MLRNSPIILHVVTIILFGCCKSISLSRFTGYIFVHSCITTPQRSEPIVLDISSNLPLHSMLWVYLVECPRFKAMMHALHPGDPRC